MNRNSTIRSYTISDKLETMKLVIYIVLIGMLGTDWVAAKKGSKKKSKVQMTEKEMFGSKSLKCLVCQALVDEINVDIQMVSPTKMTQTGSFRLTAEGDRVSNMVCISDFCSG